MLGLIRENDLLQKSKKIRVLGLIEVIPAQFFFRVLGVTAKHDQGVITTHDSVVVTTPCKGQSFNLQDQPWAGADFAWREGRGALGARRSWAACSSRSAFYSEPFHIKTKLPYAHFPQTNCD